MPRSHLAAAVVIAVGFAAVVGGLAFSALDADNRQNVLEDAVGVAMQFIAIAVAGAVVKAVLDDMRERERKADEAIREREASHRQAQQRQSAYIRRILDADHRVERAQMLINANRSVRTWSLQMQREIIEAYVGLRNINHDLVTAQQANSPIFASSDHREHISQMVGFLEALIAEYGESHKQLSEMQREAEKDRAKQELLWQRLLALPKLGDFVNRGPRYAMFQTAYARAISGMRAELEAKPPASPSTDPTV